MNINKREMHGMRSMLSLLSRWGDLAERVPGCLCKRNQSGRVR